MELTQSALEGADQTIIQSVIGLFKDLNLITAAQQADNNNFKTLESLLIKKDKNQPDADAFVFIEPQHTWEQLVAKLKHIKPEKDHHFRVVNGVLYVNTNDASFIDRTEEEAGDILRCQRVEEGLALQIPVQLTAEQRQAAYQ